MSGQHTPATAPRSRRLIFECRASDGFRTSPIVFGSGAAELPGLNAASIQLAEHALLAHDGDTSAGFVGIDVPEDD